MHKRAKLETLERLRHAAERPGGDPSSLPGRSAAWAKNKKGRYNHFTKYGIVFSDRLYWATVMPKFCSLPGIGIKVEPFLASFFKYKVSDYSLLLQLPFVCAQHERSLVGESRYGG